MSRYAKKLIVFSSHMGGSDKIVWGKEDRVQEQFLFGYEMSSYSLTNRCRVGFRPKLFGFGVKCLVYPNCLNPLNCEYQRLDVWCWNSYLYVNVLNSVQLNWESMSDVTVSRTPCLLNKDCIFQINALVFWRITLQIRGTWNSIQ